MTLKRLGELWAELTRPYDDETEMEYLRKEREMLWRTVDRLEREAASARGTITLLEAQILQLKADREDRAAELDEITAELEEQVKLLRFP